MLLTKLKPAGQLGLLFAGPSGKFLAAVVAGLAARLAGVGLYRESSARRRVDGPL